MNLTMRSCFPRDRSSTASWWAAIAATYTFKVEGDSLRSNLSCRKESTTPIVHLRGSSRREEHQVANRLHFSAYVCLVEGALAWMMVSTTAGGRPLKSAASRPGATHGGSLDLEAGAIWCRAPEKGGPSSEECAREVLSRGKWVREPNISGLPASGPLRRLPGRAGAWLGRGGRRSPARGSTHRPMCRFGLGRSSSGGCRRAPTATGRLRPGPGGSGGWCITPGQDVLDRLRSAAVPPRTAGRSPRRCRRTALPGRWWGRRESVPCRRPSSLPGWARDGAPGPPWWTIAFPRDRAVTFVARRAKSVAVRSSCINPGSVLHSCTCLSALAWWNLQDSHGVLLGHLAARAAVSLQALDGRRGRFLQVAAFRGHKCTATALSTWGMPAYPLATPPSRVVRTEKADERLLAVKGAIHELVSSSCTSGKKGTGAGRGCEPRSAPRNHRPAARARDWAVCWSPARCSRLPGQAWPSVLGPVRRWQQHPRGAAPPHLHPQRTWTHPPMLRSTSYLQMAHRMKCWAPCWTDQRNHLGTGRDVRCVRSKRSVGACPAERLLQ